MSGGNRAPNPKYLRYTLSNILVYASDVNYPGMYIVISLLLRVMNHTNCGKIDQKQFNSLICIVFTLS